MQQRTNVSEESLVELTDDEREQEAIDEDVDDEDEADGDDDEADGEEYEKEAEDEL
jgi:hypothetical protein